MADPISPSTEALINALNANALRRLVFDTLRGQAAVVSELEGEVDRLQGEVRGLTALLHPFRHLLLSADTRLVAEAQAIYDAERRRLLNLPASDSPSAPAPDTPTDRPSTDPITPTASPAPSPSASPPTAPPPSLASSYATAPETPPPPPPPPPPSPSVPPLTAAEARAALLREADGGDRAYFVESRRGLLVGYRSHLGLRATAPPRLPWQRRRGARRDPFWE
ncbi:hypothetical protein MMC13_005750 [Lambiella insularis]|nr:hypothetical protein [Lambiella insularis]